jgi:hypothetical protein
MRPVGFLCLLLVAVAVRAGGEDDSDVKTPFWATKEAFANFTREHAASCALDCVDGLTKTRDSRGRWVYIIGEKDGCIDIHEIASGKQAYLSPGQQAMSVFVKPDVQIMKDCNNNSKEEKDAGEPGCIDHNDMMLSTKGCVAGAYRLKMFKDYICHNCRDKFFRQQDDGGAHKRSLLEVGDDLGQPAQEVSIEEVERHLFGIDEDQ